MFSEQSKQSPLQATTIAEAQAGSGELTTRPRREAAAKALDELRITGSGIKRHKTALDVEPDGSHKPSTSPSQRAPVVARLQALINYRKWSELVCENTLREHGVRVDPTLTHEAALQRSERVRLVGLTSTQYNGQEGNRESWLSDKERFVVTLDDGSKMRVKPANLEVIDQTVLTNLRQSFASENHLSGRFSPNTCAPHCQILGQACLAT